MNRNHKLVLNLQRFANANVQTTVLNASGNDLSPEMKTYYSKELIRLAEPELVHDQFAQKRNIPQNGGKTIEFRKFDSLGKAMTPLTEGVTPDGHSLNVSTVTATISQYGDYVTMSDLLQMTTIDKVVVEALGQLGSEAGKTSDSITRDILAQGTNVLMPNGKKSRSALEDTDLLTPDLIFQASTLLANKNAKKIEGSYVAIIHPFVKYDLMKNDDFVEVNKYTTSDKIFNNEIGKIGGVRFVESTEAKIWKDDTCPSGKAVFGTIILGADAYATTELEGGGLQTIVKQLGAGDDPLNQRSTVGFKLTKTAKILVEQYMIRLETLSAYSDIAEAN